MRYIQCLKNKNGLIKDSIYKIYNITSRYIVIIVNDNNLVFIDKMVKPEVNNYFRILTIKELRKIKIVKLNNICQ